MEPQNLEVWVQTGIPENGELVFNVHFRNVSSIEWEVFYDALLGARNVNRSHTVCLNLVH